MNHFHGNTWLGRLQPVINDEISQTSSMPREILTIGRWGDDWCLHVNQIKKHRRSDCLESTLECWPGNLFADLCSTRLVCWETIAASSSGSKDGILRCNRMVLYLALVGDHW